MSEWREYLDRIGLYEELEAERLMQKRFPGAYIIVRKYDGTKLHLVPKFRDKGREVIWLLKNS
jgi:hypothetical protein